MLPQSSQTGRVEVDDPALRRVEHIGPKVRLSKLLNLRIFVVEPKVLCGGVRGTMLLRTDARTVL